MSETSTQADKAVSGKARAAGLAAPNLNNDASKNIADPEAKGGASARGPYCELHDGRYTWSLTD